MVLSSGVTGRSEKGVLEVYICRLRCLAAVLYVNRASEGAGGSNVGWRREYCRREERVM